VPDPSRTITPSSNLVAKKSMNPRKPYALTRKIPRLKAFPPTMR